MRKQVLICDICKKDVSVRECDGMLYKLDINSQAESQNPFAMLSLSVGYQGNNFNIEMCRSCNKDFLSKIASEISIYLNERSK